MKKILVFILFVVCAHAEELRTLESIQYKSQLGNTFAIITLSDGSTWRWEPDPYAENNLRRWRAGDPIHVRALNQPGLILYNPSHPLYSPTVSLSFNSYTTFPTIESIDKLKSTLTLTDGSEWRVSYTFQEKTLRYWEVGDRIVVVEGMKNEAELLNIDIPFPNPSRAERSLQVDAVQEVDEDQDLNPTE